MGCDIHAYVEVKHGNKWFNLKELDIGRNYDLFAKMAGVRNYDKIIPISEPKGLPDDVSFVVGVMSEDWGSDGHSHSWLSLEEIDTIELPLDVWFHDYSMFENIRLVFWFDN